MSKNEWIKLIRYFKNNKEYHKLKTCVEMFIKYDNPTQTLNSFYKTYKSNVIKQWIGYSYESYCYRLIEMRK